MYEIGDSIDNTIISHPVVNILILGVTQLY